MLDIHQNLSLLHTHTHTHCRSRLSDSKDERRTVPVDESDGRMINQSKHTAGLNQTPGETCSKQLRRLGVEGSSGMGFGDEVQKARTSKREDVLTLRPLFLYGILVQLQINILTHIKS